ncbi:MAG: glycosyl hydrolase 2 galactose-binding domain-containing protein [Candidatus Kryptoniota bacterium]
MKKLSLLITAFGLFFAPPFFLLANTSILPQVIVLHDNWLIQSSSRVGLNERQISSVSYPAVNWYRAVVPSTVLGTLVSDGIFKNPFQGRNLDSIPDSLFEKPWWYRTTFQLPRMLKGGTQVSIKFLGINYKADIWLNGSLVASSDSVFGGFRQFEFNVTKYLKFGGKNVLAVKIYRPIPGDVTLGFVDWNPTPPDHDMGLWRTVELHIFGGVEIKNPFVASSVDTATLKSADLVISAELNNNLNREVTGVISGTIGKIKFSKRIKLAPQSAATAVFNVNEFPQLHINHPRLWWTHDFGSPNLYNLHLEFKVDNEIIDTKEVRFGIRQISDYINEAGFRGYRLNGKRILIRGGGWTDHIFLNQDRKNLESQIEYAVNMNLNAIRMEGFWGESSDIYNLCDEKGILIMVGWSAQWEWKNVFGKEDDEFGGIKSREDMATAAQSFEDQVKWLRNHPSIYVWAYGSDKLPRPELERMYLGILARYDTTRPFLAAAKEHKSTLTGLTAVKMRGPYDYVPPVYWFVDTTYGGAFGFNTETGPGPQVPRVESLKKMLSPDSLWPINGEWYYHCSRGMFRHLDRYNEAIDRRLGSPTGLSDYERKAQYTNYEAMRAMYEAFGAFKFNATGIIQWMYNSAWPKMWWQLYDYYLNPTGAFYGAQKACEPVHIEFDPANNKIYVVNSTLQDINNLKFVARLYNFDMKKRYELEGMCMAKSNSAAMVGKILQKDSLSSTYFLDLRLLKGHKVMSTNFYALSTSNDTLNWSKSTWYVTPEKSYANLKMLNELPQVTLEVKHQFVHAGKKSFIKVELHNPSNHLAFMVYLEVKNLTTKDPVLPIFWSENYVSLLPGETRLITGHFYSNERNFKQLALEISGWNIHTKIFK